MFLKRIFYYFILFSFINHNLLAQVKEPQTIVQDNSFSKITIAVIDIEFILKKSLRYQQIKKQLQIEKSKFEEEIKQKEIEISKLVENKIKPEDPNFNESILKNQIIDIEAKKSSLAKWIYKKTLDLKNLKNSWKNNIFKDILRIVDQYQSQNNLSIIVDKKSLIAFKKDLDITFAILSILDKKSP